VTQLERLSHKAAANTGRKKNLIHQGEEGKDKGQLRTGEKKMSGMGSKRGTKESTPRGENHKGPNADKTGDRKETTDGSIDIGASKGGETAHRPLK